MAVNQSRTLTSPISVKRLPIWMPEPGSGGTGSLDDMERGWIVALRYAELVTESGHRATDQTFAKLAAVWSDSAIVEITAVIGLVNYLSRFSDALHVEVPGS